MTILQMTRPHLAYDLFKKHTDLNLAGYILPKRLTILDHEWKSRGLQPPSDPTPDTEEELKSPYLDLSVQIANDFLDYMRLKKAITKNHTRRYGSSYTWKHRVEDFSQNHQLFLDSQKGKGKHHQDKFHHIPNGLFIAVMREKNIPHQQGYPTYDPFDVNARVHFGGRALKALEQRTGKEFRVHGSF